MKPMSPLKRAGNAAAWVGVLTVLGCNSMTAPKTPYDGYLARPKIHLRVAVNVTEGLRNSQWEKVAPVGEAVAAAAPMLAERTFTEVVAAPNGGTPSGSVDAVLTPKIVYAGETTGATSFGQRIVSVKIEWTLTDSAGTVIWVDTFTGAGTGSTGGAYRAELLKTALETALMRAQRALWYSPAVREYARRKYSEVELVENPAAKITRPEVRKLCETLESSDVDEVMNALKALRKMDAPEAVPEILPCLQLSNPNIIRDACRTLAVLGNKETVPYLEPLLKNSRRDVRQDAQAAIAALRAKP